VILTESWNEWDPLEAVIVGDPTYARVPAIDKSLKAIQYANVEWDQIPSGPYPEQVLEEGREDLTRFCEALTGLGIDVHRPDPRECRREFGNGHWQSGGYAAYCPRDSLLVHGRTIIETPMALRSRYFETHSYRPILQAAFAGGARWLAAPKPLLRDEAFATEAVSADRLTLNEYEPCFDAANVLRCGRDLFYLVSNSGNKLGAKWLARTLGEEFRVHTIENVYSYMHLDSTVSFLRPGLVLLNPARIRPDNLPPLLAKWDKIWCAEPVDIGYHGPYNHASMWIGMNLLMVRPDLAVVEERQVPLIRQLESRGIEVLALPLRQARTLGGGFHCATLDLRRRGGLENYFS
jgi:scyllo-inosamine-4-phosphate amidinotransferase 1